MTVGPTAHPPIALTYPASLKAQMEIFVGEAVDTTDNGQITVTHGKRGGSGSEGIMH